MDSPEAPKPKIEVVRKTSNSPRGRETSPRTRDAFQEIDGVIGHIGQVTEILKEYDQEIKTLKATYQETSETHTAEIKTLREQLLALTTNYETTQSQLNLKNAAHEGKLEGLEKLLAETASTSTETSNFHEQQKQQLNKLSKNFTKLQDENIVLKSRVKLFGTISTVSFVGLVLAFWIWVDSYMGLRKHT